MWNTYIHFPGNCGLGTSSFVHQVLLSPSEFFQKAFYLYRLVNYNQIIVINATMVNILKKHEIMKILPTLVIMPSSESAKFRGSRGIGGLVPSCPRACYVGPQFSVVGISWVPNFFPVGILWVPNVSLVDFMKFQNFLRVCRWYKC